MSILRYAVELWLAFDIVGLACVAIWIDRPPSWLFGDTPEGD